MVAGGAVVRGSSENQSESKGGSHQLNDKGGRTFVMYHGTSWRNWQRIKRQGFLLSNRETVKAECWQV